MQWGRCITILDRCIYVQRFDPRLLGWRYWIFPVTKRAYECCLHRGCCCSERLTFGQHELYRHRMGTEYVSVSNLLMLPDRVLCRSVRCMWQGCTKRVLAKIVNVLNGVQNAVNETLSGER
jgi:hypothetical protein